MTVKELINKLNEYDKEKVVVIYIYDGDSGGWTNIGKIDENGSTIRLHYAQYTLFDNN